MSMTDLIREAYIDPIRSVMVVDDEYPTLSKFVSGQDTSNAVDKTRLQDVVNVCRLPDNNWMLDVHDGQFSETGDFDNLHHSDLLILDYHLEGNGDDGKGVKSLSVLSSLAKKEHFNLVVVHTKGYAAIGGDEGFRSVFKDIVFHLQKSKTFQDMPTRMMVSVTEAIDVWNDEQPGTLDEILNTISDLDFLKLIELNLIPMKIPDTKRELQELKVKFESRPIGEDDSLDSLNFNQLVWYVLSKKGQTLTAEFGSENFDDFEWSHDETSLWIKAGNLFVVVVGKDISTADLPVKLLEALEHWCPHPHRMLLAKLRHKVDEHGFSFESDLLDKQYMHAGWLRDLLQCEVHELEEKSWITTQNHLEELAWRYKSELSQYLAKVVSTLTSAEKNLRVIEDQYAHKDILDCKFEIFKSVNAFNNSIPVDGAHLTTGHILRDLSKNLHLVVTPACDLVPGRSKYGKLDIVIQRLYPVASALKKDSDTGKLAEEELFTRCKGLVNSKQLLFLTIDGDLSIYASTSKPFNNTNPSLMNLAIANDGIWNGEKKVLAYNLNLSLTPPQVRSCEYEIVGQLRYEYALHHSKISGEHMSRIGLDYQN
jgi:hypothetical protein